MVEAELLLGRAHVLVLAAAATYVALLERLLLLRHERGERRSRGPRDPRVLEQLGGDRPRGGVLVTVRVRVRVRLRLRLRLRLRNRSPLPSSCALGGRGACLVVRPSLRSTGRPGGV